MGGGAPMHPLKNNTNFIYNQEGRDEHRRKDKKHKKDKDREKDKEGQTKVPKLVLKGHTPSGSPTRENPIKLKIKLGGTPAVEWVNFVQFKGIVQ